MYYDHTYVYVHRPQQQQHHCKRAAGDSPLVAQLAEARKKKRATEIVAENQRDGGFVAATEKLVPSFWTSHPAYGSTSMGEEISRWVRRGRSSTRSSPRVHLLRAMRLAREGCKSVHQPGLLSCFRNAEERRRCEVMEAALRPQKRGPRQRTSVTACRVR